MKILFFSTVEASLSKNYIFKFTFCEVVQNFDVCALHFRITDILNCFRSYPIYVIVIQYEEVTVAAVR